MKKVFGVIALLFLLIVLAFVLVGAGIVGLFNHQIRLPAPTGPHPSGTLGPFMVAVIPEATYQGANMFQGKRACSFTGCTNAVLLIDDAGQDRAIGMSEHHLPEWVAISLDRQHALVPSRDESILVDSTQASTFAALPPWAWPGVALLDGQTVLAHDAHTLNPADGFNLTRYDQGKVTSLPFAYRGSFARCPKAWFFLGESRDHDAHRHSLPDGTIGPALTLQRIQADGTFTLTPVTITQTKEAPVFIQCLDDVGERLAIASGDGEHLTVTTVKTATGESTTRHYRDPTIGPDGFTTWPGGAATFSFGDLAIFDDAKDGAATTVRLIDELLPDQVSHIGAVVFHDATAYIVTKVREEGLIGTHQVWALFRLDLPSATIREARRLPLFDHYYPDTLSVADMVIAHPAAFDQWLATQPAYHYE